MKKNNKRSKPKIYLCSHNPVKADGRICKSTSKNGKSTPGNEKNSMIRGLENLRESVKAELRIEVRKELLPKARAEVRKEIMAEVRAEVRDKIRDEVKAEARQKGAYLCCAKLVRNGYFDAAAVKSILGVSMEEFWEKVNQFEKEQQETQAKDSPLLA